LSPGHLIHEARREDEAIAEPDVRCGIWRIARGREIKVNRTDEFGLTVENTYDLLMGLGFRVSDPSLPV